MPLYSQRPCAPSFPALNLSGTPHPVRRPSGAHVRAHRVRRRPGRRPRGVLLHFVSGASFLRLRGPAVPSQLTGVCTQVKAKNDQTVLKYGTCLSPPPRPAGLLTRPTVEAANPMVTPPAVLDARSYAHTYFSFLSITAPCIARQ